MRPPFAIGLLLLLFGFGRLLLIIFFVLLISTFHICPIDSKPEQFRVHFLRSPDGKWLSLLNLRVVFQSPDFVDIDEEIIEEPVDFDDNDDWTIITIDPIPIRPQLNWTGKLLGELTETEKIYGENEEKATEKTMREDGMKKMERKEEEIKKKKEETVSKEIEEKEEEKGVEEMPKLVVPELDLLKEMLPWIPHLLRKHHKTNKQRIHLEDILMGKSTTIGIGGGMEEETTMKVEEEKSTTEIATEIGSSTIEEEEILTTTEEPQLEPINEEELALNLHEDSLHRNESTLRQMLNGTSLDDGGTIRKDGEAFRDLGSSFILPLLKEIKYDNKSIPLVFADESLKVTLSLEVLHLGNFDNFQMEYELDVLFHLQWYDVRLANNFTKAVRIKEQSIIDRIWKPDSLFFNSKFSYFHLVSFPNFRMRIQPDGHITYTSRVTLLPDCQMNFCNFPHDTQRCDLLISSIAHPKAMLEYHWDPVQPILFSKKISLPDLDIKNISTEQCRIGGKLIPSSCLTLSLVLQRESARYIAEKYLPSTLAMIFSWVAPYVPYNYEEVRIITPITVLLTLVQMEKGNQEVITSYLTSLDIWFVVIKAFTVLSLIESLTVMAYIKRARAIEKQAQRASNEYQKDLLQAEAKRIVRLYHRLDHFSRVFFPVAFCCFLIFYLGFIAQRDEHQCQEQKIDFDKLESVV